MTDSYQRQPGGLGPHEPKMRPPAFTSQQGLPRQTTMNVSPISRPAVNMGVDPAGIAQGVPFGHQQGLRMEQNNPGLGLTPSGFVGTSGGAHTPVSAASGYYGYSMGSLYPYNMMGHGTGLDPERLAAVNRALALVQPPGTPTAATATATAAVNAAGVSSAAGTTQGAMESSWGAQFSARGRGWPSAVTPQELLAQRNPNLSFPTASTLASGTPKSAPATSGALDIYSAPRNFSVVNGGGSSEISGGFKGATKQATGYSAGVTGKSPCPTTGDSGSGEADQEDGNQSKSGLGSSEQQPENNGEFELDSAGKRRRLTAEERLQRSRERNQLHARKTRQRKKQQLQLLMTRSAELQTEQQRLRQAIADRRTASILLGMSGTDDSHAGVQASNTSRGQGQSFGGVGAHNPPQRMLLALECDDVGEGGSGKGSVGNGSDDLGSESAAGMTSSASSSSASSSGRTSSETNSSDGALGGEDATGVKRVGEADGQPKVGNPGDTERLLELSQKTRSECTPEELEQIRRERNRMHAKRTRDRKKLHLEATEGMIARLEEENQKLLESLEAIGTCDVVGGGANTGPGYPVAAAVSAGPAGVAAAALASGTRTASVSPEAGVAGFEHPPCRAPPLVTPQHAVAQAHQVHSPPHPPSHQFANHAFLHHGAHMQPQFRRHGMYPQHHVPAGPHLLQPVGAQHMGYYTQGSAGFSGGAVGSVGADVNGARMVKPHSCTYDVSGGRMVPVSFVGHSGAHYPQQHSVVQLSDSNSPFSPAQGKPPVLPSPPQTHVAYPLPEPSEGYQGVDGQGQGAGPPSYVSWASASSAAKGIGVASKERLTSKNEITALPASSSVAETDRDRGDGATAAASDKSWGDSKTASSINGTSSGQSAGSGSGTAAAASENPAKPETIRPRPPRGTAPHGTWRARERTKRARRRGRGRKKKAKRSWTATCLAVARRRGRRYEESATRNASAAAPARVAATTTTAEVGTGKAAAITTAALLRQSASRLTLEVIAGKDRVVLRHLLPRGWWAASRAAYFQAARLQVTWAAGDKVRAAWRTPAAASRTRRSPRIPEKTRCLRHRGMTKLRTARGIEVSRTRRRHRMATTLKINDWTAAS
ncbi:unnamed protein product [Ascophyllum nodosum]